MKTKGDSHSSVSIRFAIVIFIAAVLLIPLLLVQGVISDRHRFYEEAVHNVERSWSDSQYIEGPIMVVPAVQRIQAGMSMGTKVRHIGVMPGELDLWIEASHEWRHIDTFKAPVLTVQLRATGRFDPVDLEEMSHRFGNTLPGQAMLQLRLKDVRGAQNVTAEFNGKVLQVEPGASTDLATFDALLTDIDISRGGTFNFQAQLRSTEGLSLVAVGDDSRVYMESTWPHPKFSSRLLPDEREVHADGFEARWQINKLNRGFGSIAVLEQNVEGVPFTGPEPHLIPMNPVPNPQAAPVPPSAGTTSAGIPGARFEPVNRIGFDLFDPVTPYRAVVRSVKYGILFIGLTLAAFLCIELMTRTRFHYVQYLVIGTALITFFLVLLSLAEKTGFDGGYLLASGLMTAMLCGYTYSSSRDTRITGAILVLLVILYAVLYTILKLDQHSLLLGTGLLLIMLGIMMYATRSLTSTRDAGPDEETSSSGKVAEGT